MVSGHAGRSDVSEARLLTAAAHAEAHAFPAARAAIAALTLEEPANTRAAAFVELLKRDIKREGQVRLVNRVVVSVKLMLLSLMIAALLHSSGWRRCGWLGGGRRGILLVFQSLPAASSYKAASDTQTARSRSLPI